MPTALTPDQLQHALELRDLTDPKPGTMSIQMLVDVAVDALERTWRCDVRSERGPRVVPLSGNYDRLRYPQADVTRDARYTRYVDDGHVLRSHASAMIPPALARLADNPADDVLLVSWNHLSPRLHRPPPHRHAPSAGPVAHHPPARRRR